MTLNPVHTTSNLLHRYFYQVAVCKYRPEWESTRMRGQLYPFARPCLNLLAFEVLETSEIDVSVYQSTVRLVLFAYSVLDLECVVMISIWFQRVLIYWFIHSCLLLTFLNKHNKIAQFIGLGQYGHICVPPPPVCIVCVPPLSSQDCMVV